MSDKIGSTTPRSQWTASPSTVIGYLIGLEPRDRRRILNQYKMMSEGGHGGQIEAWSFDTVRSAIYPNWQDEDFREVVEAFEDKVKPTMPDLNQLEG